MTANKSGIHLTAADIPIVLGMSAREDREHDIAAWFGVNQGRIAEAKKGKFGTPSIAPIYELPPRGPPGIKGRRLRDAVANVLALLNKGGEPDIAAAKLALEGAAELYDTDEP